MQIPKHAQWQNGIPIWVFKCDPPVASIFHSWVLVALEQPCKVVFNVYKQQPEDPVGPSEKRSKSSKKNLVSSARFKNERPKPPHSVTAGHFHRFPTLLCSKTLKITVTGGGVNAVSHHARAWQLNVPMLFIQVLQACMFLDMSWKFLYC